MAKTGTFRRQITDAVTMFLVSGLSLMLLIYVAYGEAQRTYSQFHLEKLAAEARVVQNVMETFLRPGLPLKQFVGFATVTEPVLSSDTAISSLAAFDREGRRIFTSGDTEIPLLPETESGAGGNQEDFEHRNTDQYLQVVLPLRSRFETVGHLAITMPRTLITDRVGASFRHLVLVALCLSVVFACSVAFAGPRIKQRRKPWLQILYAVTFLAMSGVVVGTLISLYAEGAQAKTKALADTMGQRLSGLIRFEININEIRGLDHTFNEFRRLNPDISAAGVTINGEILIHTNGDLVGRPWISSDNTYEYVVHLTPPGSLRDIRVAVALPTDVVLQRIARSVKNFMALFVASAFLAGLFLQLAGSVHPAQAMEGRDGSSGADTTEADRALYLVKPVFFVAVFLEHLNYAFLPQFVYRVVEDAGLSTALASAPFMAYYLCFALALIPAGHFAQHNSTRPLMYIGLALAGGGLLTMAFFTDFYLVVFSRALSGVGQGMLFIGVQSYILTMASPAKRTQGAGIIVFGFQGGMISGMAIGSLLVTYLGPLGVFALSGIVAYALALYAVTVVPVAIADSDVSMRVGFTLGQLAKNLVKVLRSIEFLRTMLLIGIPAKAVLTGVVIFALPLLLAQQEYAQEDIGQIIMVYAAGVVIASTYASRFVDRTGHTSTILFWGSLLSGFGLLLVGLMDWSPVASGPDGSARVTTILIVGVAIVGIAHGLINAPVVTHVADSGLAAQVGASSLTATYRFLERLGHIAGPIIVSQLFLLWGQSAYLLCWIGVGIFVCGLLFILPFLPGQHTPAKSETV